MVDSYIWIFYHAVHTNVTSRLLQLYETASDERGTEMIQGSQQNRLNNVQIRRRAQAR